MSKNVILVGTDLTGLDGVKEEILKICNFTNSNLDFYDFGENEFLSYSRAERVLAVFVNPNSLMGRLDASFFLKYSNLKVICTASTGTVHIDCEVAKKHNVDVISIAKELDVLRNVSSTAELAWLFTMLSVRPAIEASQAAALNNWDYRPFIGRQIRDLRICSIGNGRLGRIYLSYAFAFGAQATAFDIKDFPSRLELENALVSSLKNYDVIALNIHAEGNECFISSRIFASLKSDVVLINTSRGELVCDDSLFDFLTRNPGSRYYTDVISNEWCEKSRQKFIDKAMALSNVFITPHIGGMSAGARIAAYGRAVQLLRDYLINAQSKNAI